MAELPLSSHLNPNNINIYNIYSLEVFLNQSHKLLFAFANIVSYLKITKQSSISAHEKLHCVPN